MTRSTLSPYMVNPPPGRRSDRGSLWKLLAALGGLVGVIALLVFGVPNAPGSSDIVTAVLVDGNAPLAAPAAFERVLGVAQADGEQLLVGPLAVVDHAASEYMKPEGDQEIARRNDIARKLTNVRNRFNELRATTASGSAIDGLHILNEHLQPMRHGTVNVVLLGELLRVAPQVDLHDPVTRADPESVVKRVKGLIDDCRSWKVHVVGGAAELGDSRADGQVREVWRQLIHSCGGDLVLWDNTQLTAFPGTGIIQAAMVAPCQLEVNLPGDVLFGGDQWSLQPAAMPMLQSLLEDITVTHPGATAEITGHSANSTQTKYNLVDLSRYRAGSVGGWLTAHGVAADRIKTRGVGPADPVAPNDTEAGQRLNRRVEVQLHLPATECHN